MRRARPSRSAAGRADRAARASLGAGQPDQDLVLLVGHVVDALAQRLAAGPRERGLQPAAVLGLEHLPAGCRGTAPPAGRTRMPGMTRSRLWRLRSTIQSDVAEPAAARSSTTASQTLPSSSSASPTRATKRRSGWRARRRSGARRSGRPARRTAGATAPRPTEPVEKSTGSGSLVRLGYACRPPNCAQRRSGTAGRGCRAGTGCAWKAGRGVRLDRRRGRPRAASGSRARSGSRRPRR